LDLLGSFNPFLDDQVSFSLISNLKKKGEEKLKKQRNLFIKSFTNLVYLHKESSLGQRKSLITSIKSRLEK